MTEIAEVADRLSALAVFIDLMARRPHVRGLGYAPDDAALILGYASRFGIKPARMALDIARHRDSLSSEPRGSVMDQVAHPQPGIAGGGKPRPQPGGERVVLAALRIGALTLELVDGVDIRLGENVCLRVRGQKQGNEMFEHVDAAGEGLDFKPELAVVVGGHDGCSSVIEWRGAPVVRLRVAGEGGE